MATSQLWTIRVPREQGVLYKINYDNVYHLKYRRAARGGDVGRDVITEKYILSMRIMLMGYEHALQERRKLGRDRASG
jgi:hypothetical protein